MSLTTKAAALRAMAASASDPNLRRYAIEAASKAENNSAALLQIKNDRDAILGLLLSLDPAKKCPSDDALAEMLDITPSRAASGRESLLRDGRLLGDGTLDPRVRQNQKPGSNSLRQHAANDAAVSQAAEAGTAAGHAVTARGNQAGKLVSPKGLHGAALTRTIGEVQSGRAQMITKREQDQIASMRDQIANLTETVNQIRNR